MDPLAQYVCPLYVVHTEEELPRHIHLPCCYEPRPIDEEVCNVVQEEYKRWGDHGEEEWADFISEEGSFTKSTWNNLA
jgi:hypothetical protein